ncbi:MAG: alpha/beta hydrolase [Paraglaciecola polaris]|uniref:alpha/beta hydrolase n=1 Tax=Paraglaciecola polaris TaxID=222814 RepID=UPI003002F116|tara:strand:- start:3397 stop:4320 length:924 start_codon:yes stop_codon:yes gene_type:complete
MLKILLIILLGLAIWLGVCWYQDSRATALSILNTALKLLQPTDVVKDIPFAQQPWQTLDVYSSSIKDKPAPVLVFIHGGGWNWGSKDMYYFVAQAFVKRGYTVVVPNYIKYPAGRFPAFIEDGAQALAWVKANIVHYQGDPQQIFLAGHSAGAHTGALLLTDQHYLAEVGLSRSVIRGFAGIAGPYAFTPDSPEYIATFGPDNFNNMKANLHVVGGEPPMLLLHAKGDSTVGQFNQQQLADAMALKQSPVETILYGENIDHTSILLKLHPWFAGDVNVGQDIDRYFQQIIAQPLASELTLHSQDSAP